MAAIVVAHNYHLALDPHETAEMKPYPPLGTVTVATDLRRRGFDVALYDATFHRDPTEFAAALRGHRPHSVLLVADHHAVLQKMCLTAQRNAAFQMIRLARAAGARVLVTGPDATDVPDEYLVAGASAVIRGEPDAGVPRWLAGETGIPGLMETADSPAEPAPPMDLVGLPLVDWSFVDLRAYAARWRGCHGFWEAPVSSARGCPYRCNWCAKPVWGKSLNLRPADQVVADARELGARGADRIWFTDDIFALKPSWLRDFRQAVERAGGVPPYRCLSRVDLMVKREYVADLAATGCAEVWVGAESGSDSVLTAMDKDATVDDIHVATRLLHEHGIRVGFFLQLGYPGERLHDVLATMAMVREIVPEQIGISVSYPLPGTVFYERVKDQLTEANWQTAMDNRILYESDFPQGFYDAARECIRREHAVRRVLPEVRAGALRMAARRALAAPKHLLSLPWQHAKLRWYARGVA